MSRIGKKPIILPQGVKVELKDGTIAVKGPKGSLSRPLLEGLEVEITDTAVNLKRSNDDKRSRSYHG
ncbi:MAG: 50S ribosomal protein L6, partial [candidate division WOR-3 bacterium]